MTKQERLELIKTKFKSLETSQGVEEEFSLMPVSDQELRQQINEFDSFTDYLRREGNTHLTSDEI
jgi:hypothetical protein